MRKILAVSAVALTSMFFTGSAFAQGTTAPAPGGAAPAPATEAPAAEGDGGTGFRFGLRTGYMIPLGDISEKAPLSDQVSGGVPIWLDVGYRIIPPLYVGLYFNYGLLFAADKCKDCSIKQIRFGVMAAYHFIPAGQIDPWVGYGLGYESVSVSAGGSDGSIKGLEFANLQLGADYKVTPNIRIGPFASFSLGQYSSVSSGGNSADITKTAMHQWLTIGIRGAYDL